MSKKWITIFVAAVIAAMVMSPTAAMATCRASIVGQLAWNDITSSSHSRGDPAPLIPGDAVNALADGPITPTTALAAGGTASNPSINAEGQAERLADLLIEDDNGDPTLATFCFNPGNIITLTYNGVLTSPAVGTSLSQVTNMDVFDTKGIGGLSISSATVSQAFAANTVQTLITINVGAKGSGVAATALYDGTGSAKTDGSALRIKNLRIDATTATGGTGVLVNIAQGANTVVVIVGATGGASNTVATKFVTNTATSVALVSGGVSASGVQNSGTGLRGAPQSISFTNNVGMPGGYRKAAGSCTSATLTSDTCVSQVANDVATGATSLVWAVTSIPSGITVTFPAKLDFSVGTAGKAVYTARSATLTNSGAPGSLGVIYDTTTQATVSGSHTTQTADNADPGTAAGTTNANCRENGSGNGTDDLNSGSLCNPNPKIGVRVGTSSAAGTASANVAMGPSDTSLFTNDDAATTGLIPRYTGNSAPDAQVVCNSSTAACSGVNATATRYIVKSHAFFIITATRTTLLFPFMSTIGNFNTGLSIINSCADSLGSTANSVYATSTNSFCNQTGGVTLFFFGVDPQNANAPVQVSVNTDLTQGGVSVASACRGFDANGKVAPGHGVACALGNFISAGLLGASVKGFDGYVMAVASFQNAHGFSAQFNGNGAPFAANSALVLGSSARAANDTGAGAGN